MEKVNSGYLINGTAELDYEIFDSGFNIYIGKDSTIPSFSQPEPYIPYPNLSYEENAKKMCEDLSSEYSSDTKNKKSVDERLTDIEANIDYLMLLNDADSVTEEETK